MADMTLQQIQQNPLLNALVAPYLQPGAQLGQTQQATQTSAAEGGLINAQTPGAQATSQVDQQKANQTTAIANSKAAFEAAKDSKTGYVSPQLYNAMMANASQYGVTADTFENTFKGYVNPQQEIGYNTGEGRVQSQTYAQIKRQIEGQLDQYNQIPNQEKGIWGNYANASQNSLMNTLFNNPGNLPNKIQEIKEGKTNYLQQNAPNAAGYVTSKEGLAGQFKDLIGANRVTQSEINNWTALLPDPGDSPALAQKKIQELNTSLQKTFNTPSGLDSKYLQQNNAQQVNAGSPGKQLLTTLAAKANDQEPPEGNKIHPGAPQGDNGALQLLGGIGVPLAADVASGGLALPVTTALSGAGAGAGQFIQDLLSGKKPGADVPITAGASAAGELTGGVGAKIFGKVGGALLSKVPGDVFDKVVNATPNFVTKVADLKNVASKYGLMTGSVMDGLNKMPQVMSDIGGQIQSLLTKNRTPVNLMGDSKNPGVIDTVLKDFESKSSSFENSQDFKNAQDYIKNRIFQGTGNGKPLSEIFGANGQKVESQAAQTTYSNLYKLKSQVANDLKPVFKAQENPAANTNFTPKQEANLALWDGLKKVLDGAGGQIRQLNDDQHAMFTIAKGFGKNLGKGGVSAYNDIIDAAVGQLVGGHPLAGVVVGRLARNQNVLDKIGKGLTSPIIQKGLPATGAAVGSGLGAILGMPQAQ